LYVGKIPTAAEGAIKVHQSQFPSKIVVNRRGLRGIHLNLSINNFQVAGQPIVVPACGKSYSLAISIDGDDLLVIGLGQLLVC